MPLTLGSLFDGIGVFPLAARQCGITPLWASEISAPAISITKRHFPQMTHLGSITGLSGGSIPPVDIITFGSPCQNLSLTGTRTGLAGEQSSLFYEAIRIIEEMRCATQGFAWQRPLDMGMARILVAEDERSINGLEQLAKIRGIGIMKSC